jgi:HK97 family phage major capsid protein
MRSSTQIKDAIHDLREELDAIVAVSEREERDLTEEEANRTSEITDKLIPQLNKSYKSALSIEKERLQRASARGEEVLNQVAVDSGNAAQSSSGNSRVGAIKIPAKAKAHGVLNAYKGQDAEREAYIAGMVFLAGAYGSESAANFCRMHGLQVNATLQTTANSTGGFVTPDEMLAAIIRLREERGVFPRFANNMPMGSDIIRVPRLLADVTAYWPGEGLEITASDPTLGNAELMARKLGALCKISSELDEDAVIAIGDMVTTSIAYAMADKIDDAGFNGNGESAYGGNVGLANALHANAVVDAIGGNTGAGTLDLDDFNNVLAKCPQYGGASNRWFMHSAVYYAACHRLMNAAGGNTNITLANGVVEPMFQGYPVTFVQVMPSVITASPSTILAYFGDLRLGATYGTRRSARTEVSTERYFELDLIGIKTTERVAINVHERGETIRTRPILALKTAAS